MRRANSSGSGRPDSIATLISEVKIPYPAEARTEQIEGAVLLRLVIDADGNVISAKVLRGPGYGLNEGALDAMRRFKFTPASRSGAAVPSEIEYQYVFVLE